MTSKMLLTARGLVVLSASWHAYLLTEFSTNTHMLDPSKAVFNFLSGLHFNNQSLVFLNHPKKVVEIGNHKFSQSLYTFLGGWKDFLEIIHWYIFIYDITYINIRTVMIYTVYIGKLPSCRPQKNVGQWKVVWVYKDMYVNVCYCILIYTLQGTDTYPTLVKGKSSSKVPWVGIC